MKSLNFYKYLPYFDQSYSFGFCTLQEIDEVRRFIDVYWKKGHALAVSRPLMDWQHLDKMQARYNFSVARCKATGEIYALSGFIPTSQFDAAIIRPMLWGALWKSREDVAQPGLGVMVEQFFLENIPHLLSSGLSFSKDNIRIHKSRKDTLGQTLRFFILNDKMETHRLCAPNGAPCFTPAERGTDAFVQLAQGAYEAASGSAFSKLLAYKSKLYYVNRYYRHPIYTYYATGIKSESGDLKAVFFWRFCEHEGARCIRIVDYIGDGSELAGNLHNFRQLLYDTGAEFIDFIEYGIPEAAMQAGGFVDLAETGAVLAHYFEPFVLQNVDMCFSFPHEDPTYPIQVFKGDADQDRPNLIL